jgi:hypothetical protein
MRKISSVIMACAMCLSMTVVGTVAPQVAVQAEETATVELKEAPKAPSTYKTAAGYDCQLNYGDDAEKWLSAIDKVEVNGIEYEKATSYNQIWNNAKYYAKATLDSSDSTDVRYLLIGEGKFEKDESAVNKVVISAQGYKKLVLEVNKNGKKVAIHANHTGGTATCTKKAVCEFCGEEYGEYASHNYEDKYESDGTYHWKKCQNEGCDATTEKEAHKGGEATTTKRAVCEVCGAEYGDLKQEDPKPADKTTEGKKDDTKPAEKPDKKTVKAKKVVVNKKRIVLKKGKKVKLKAKLKPANATEKVTFKSTNKKVAKVTKKGVVKAVKKGKCKITVKTASGKKAVVKVTVK